MDQPMQPQTGSVSHGTLRAEDLIPAFVHELQVHEDLLVPDDKRLLDEIWKRSEEEDYFDSEDVTGDLESLFDMLDSIAPKNHYFGTHEGDGSDFGYWPITEE